METRKPAVFRVYAYIYSRLHIYRSSETIFFGLGFSSGNGSFIRKSGFYFVDKEKSHIFIPVGLAGFSVLYCLSRVIN